jgi:transposase
VLLDETGFLLQPLNRRTWAPTGVRPQQYAWDRHDRLSVVGSMSISPRRRRLNVFFRVQEENVRAPHVMRYLRDLHRQHRRPLIVVMDRLNVHRSAVRRLRERGARWLHVEWLPAYAPELNPVEPLWSQTKFTDLANFIPDDVHHLHDAVIEAIGDLQFRPQLLRSFFQSARLPL